MFIAALFIIVKIWKQPRHPSTDEWVKKMWSIYNFFSDKNLYIYLYIYRYIYGYIYIERERAMIDR